jgi:hypothetical protein
LSWRKGTSENKSDFGGHSADIFSSFEKFRSQHVHRVSHRVVLLSQQGIGPEQRRRIVANPRQIFRRPFPIGRS